jgi:hypothetical protein
VLATPGENVHFEFRYASDAVLPATFQWRKETLHYTTNVLQVSNPDDPTGVYWRTNIVPTFTSTNLPGETNATLLLSNVHNSEIEYYSIAVSNAMGLCSSHPSGLRVDSAYAGVTTNDHWSEVFCFSNLKMIGIGRSLWATEHNDQFPESFQSMTNNDGSPLLGWPVALFCRSDTNRSAPAEWSGVDYSNTSYEIMNDDPQNPFAMFCRCRVHGFYLQMDGGAVRQPSFSNIARRPDKTFELTFRVFAGKTNVLEASPDLLNWSTLQTYDSALGEIQFTDSAPSGPQRFYRLRLP